MSPLSVTFGKGIFVMGGNGIIATSENGEEWLTRYVPVSIEFSRVAYCGEHFLATGYAGYMLRSTNGSDWEEVNPGGTASFRGMSWDGSNYVAVGSEGTIITSTGPEFWTPRTSGTGNGLWDVIYAQGKFVVVGEHGTILTSSNAVNWTPRNSGTTQDLFCVTFANGRFVAAGWDSIILYSTNGFQWDLSPNAANYADNIPASSLLRAATYGGNRFVLVGATIAGIGTIATSPDGQTWTQIYGALQSITHGASGFVAVGELGGVRVSADGQSWTNGTVGVGSILRGITYGQNKYVVVGDQGTIGWSTNANDWMTQTVGTNSLQAVTFASNIFVAVGNRRTVLVSPNGSDWHYPAQTPFVGSTLQSVCHGMGKFVIAGEFGELGVSTDGENWILGNLPVLSHPTWGYSSVTYGKGQFVAVGQATILSSMDGTNWLSRFPQTNLLSFRRVVFGQGMFAAVTSGGEIFLSSDGANWKKTTSIGTQGYEYVSDIIYVDGSFWALTVYGGIMQSQDVFSLLAGKWLAQAGLELSLSGKRGRVYQIQSSANLAQWTNLLMLTNDSGVADFIDPGATNVPCRHYRAVLP